MAKPVPGPAAAGDAADPPPRPPQKPLASDCCDGGCDRCVYDIYSDELAAYALELHAWQARQARRDGP